MALASVLSLHPSDRITLSAVVAMISKLIFSRRSNVRRSQDRIPYRWELRVRSKNVWSIGYNDNYLQAIDNDRDPGPRQPPRSLALFVYLQVKTLTAFQPKSTASFDCCIASCILKQLVLLSILLLLLHRFTLLYSYVRIVTVAAARNILAWNSPWLPKRAPTSSYHYTTRQT